jgi:hypothetical protein
VFESWETLDAALFREVRPESSRTSIAQEVVLQRELVAFRLGILDKKYKV